MSRRFLDCNKQLENQMEKMCEYLDKLVTSSDEGEDGDEKNYMQHICAAKMYSDINTHAHDSIARNESHPVPVASVSNIPSNNFNLVGFPLQYATNTVTSALAKAASTNSSNLRFAGTSSSNTRMKKWNNYKPTDKLPDTSDIDIDATMAELGLTPESLTQNKVHSLFSLFNNLEFSIHAEFITTTIYDQKTIPNTMSVSGQIKHAIWSSHKLLRNLREVLNRPMPAEFKSAFNKCNEALGQLQQAISNLEGFKYCTFEHRKGNFITSEAEEYLQPLMDVLNHLTGRVEKSRMYIQVYERALNAPERYKAVLLSGRADPPQHVPEESYTETSSNRRPEMARRYIG